MSASRKKRDNLNTKQRSSRACDHCRKTKSKCERLSDQDGSCESCAILGLECYFSGPVKKRGPAKGYLHAIETRCHDVEAVLGILLGIPDQRAISLLTELCEDSYVRKVIDQVNTSAFGTLGRNSVAPNAEEPTDLNEVTTAPAVGCAFAEHIVL